MRRLRGSFGARLMATMGSSTGRVALTLTLCEGRQVDREGGFGVPKDLKSAILEGSETNSGELTFNSRPRNEI